MVGFWNQQFIHFGSHIKKLLEDGHIQHMQFNGDSRFRLGCDIVTIGRIERLLCDYPDRFRKFAFSSREQEYCDEQAFPSQHYAARWAIKEAFIKALGVPGRNPDFTSIEVVREESPRLSLSEDGLDLLSQVALTRQSSPRDTTIAISMSHERQADLALGSVFVVF